MNELLLKGASVHTAEGCVEGDILISGGRIAAVGKDIAAPENVRTINLQGKHIVSGLVDVHVHLREPGFEYKETIATGTAAAAHSDSAAAGNWSTSRRSSRTWPDSPTTGAAYRRRS